jgi:hypothetical protein
MDNQSSNDQEWTEVEPEQTSPSKKPEAPRPQETVQQLNPVVIHNSVGCKHVFIQVAPNKAECETCTLGVHGDAATLNAKMAKL